VAVGPIGVALALWTLLAAWPAAAQPIWTPPDVQVEPLSKTAYPPVPIDEVAMGDPVHLASLLQELRQQTNTHQQDIAVIRVTVRGEWFLTLADIAREQASLLGANYLSLEQPFGDERVVGTERRYRALRLERNNGVPMFTRPRAAVDSEWRAPPAPSPNAPPPPSVEPPPSVAAEPASAPPPRKEAPADPAGKPLDWIWKDHGFIISHRLRLDLPRLGPDTWSGLELVVRRWFPRAEHAELLRLRRRGARIVVDMRNRRLWPAP